MTDQMKDQLKAALKDEASALIEKDFEHVFDAYKRSFQEAEPGAKFRYSFPVQLSLVPVGADVRVLSTIRAPLPAFRDESQGRLVTPEGSLFDE